MTLSQAQFDAWLLQFFLPFARIAGLLMVAPVFGTSVVPARLRLVLALLLCLLLAPLLPAAPALTPLGSAWWLALVNQVALGITMGFVLQLVFEGVMMGGEMVAYSMGLSFAQMADPIRGHSSPVVGQFLLTLAMLLFLALRGHLVLLELLADSFRTLPVDAPAFDSERLRALALFGTQIFAGGLRIALPMMVALLAVNLAFGVMSRAAPALNLIAVGFPAALIAGLVLLLFSLDALQAGFDALLREGYALILGLLDG